MKLFHFGTKVEGQCRPDAVFVFEWLRGCIGRPKSLRGFTTSVAFPVLYKNDWYDFFECNGRKWCRQFPVINWWFRFAAGGTLSNKVDLWWNPTGGY